MSKRTAAEMSPRPSLAAVGTLSRVERIALFVLVGSGALIDLFGLLVMPDPDPVRTGLSIATTLTFALYAWSPLVATIALGAAVTTAFAVGGGASVILAPAIAAAPVLRLARTPLIVAYGIGFLLSNTLVAYGLGGVEPTPTNVALLIVAAAFAGGIGFALRSMHLRGARLETELEESAEREREAILAERRWIAGELHDSIAHYLTVIALHVQLLDDDDARPESQEAIRIAARKALSDLRFVIQLAEDAPTGEGVPMGELAEAIAEARTEIESAGHRTTCEGDPSDDRIPRGVDLILARIVRESATNILKYAGPGDVTIALSVEPRSIALRIHSPLPDRPRRDLPSTGTGLNRMAERVLGVSGEFSAGPERDHWAVAVRLPTS